MPHGPTIRPFRRLQNLATERPPRYRNRHNARGTSWQATGRARGCRARLAGRLGHSSQVLASVELSMHYAQKTARPRWYVRLTNSSPSEIRSIKAAGACVRLVALSGLRRTDCRLASMYQQSSPRNRAGWIVLSARKLSPQDTLRSIPASHRQSPEQPSSQRVPVPLELERRQIPGRGWHRRHG